MNTFDSALFLENIEWFDETGQELVHRFPEEGSGEIKWGAQLTVRDSQAGVLFYKGKACDAFGPGRHTLKTGNLPLLTRILSVPWRGNSPLRAEIYLVNLKHFTNLKWGTMNPVAFRDNELGLIRLRAHGVFNIRIVQPVLFINSLVGTMGQFTTDAIATYLKEVIVSRFNDYLGEVLDSILNLPGRFDELSQQLQKRLIGDFSHFGLQLSQIYITSITPPEEVQKAIDDKGRLNIIHDIDKFVKMKAASAMEKAAENQGEAGSGMGMGVGMMLPAMFAQSLNGAGAGVRSENDAPGRTTSCSACHNTIPVDARFCPWCGHQQLVVSQCANCGKNMALNAKFCSSCGHPAAEKPQRLKCPHCQTENLPGAMFCNQCGQRID